MKITLPESLIRLLNDKIFKSAIKILEIRNNSTLIGIKGHQIDVPFVLKKDTNYHAVIKDGILNIIENKKQADSEMERNTAKDILENIFQLSDKNNTNFPANPLDILKNFIKLDKKNKGGRKKSNFIFHDKNGGMVFIFDILLFDESTRLFLRIINRNIFLFFYNNQLDDNIVKEFRIAIEKYLMEKYREMIFEIKFFDKKDIFYDNISLLTSNIDIRI